MTLTPSINNCLYPGYGRRPAPVRPSNWTYGLLQSSWTDGLGLGSLSAVRLPSIRPSDGLTNTLLMLHFTGVELPYSNVSSSSRLLTRDSAGSGDSRNIGRRLLIVRVEHRVEDSSNLC